MAQIVHYSSDDEAPEEESFQVSQQKSRSKAAQIRKTVDASNSVQKTKRRARDELLKSKKKLLSEILAEQEPEPQDQQESKQSKQQIKVVRHTVKKLETEKEGFTVKVLKKSSSSLPPLSSESLVSRKERFLKRKR